MHSLIRNEAQCERKDHDYFNEIQKQIGIETPLIC